MTFVVRMLPRTQEDVLVELEWIAEHQGQLLNGVRWVDGLESAIGSLADHPERRPIAREPEFMPVAIRQLVCHSHRILFAVEGRDVLVLRVWHGRRRSATLPELRPG